MSSRIASTTSTDGLTGRATPEWIGATPDSAIPPRVKARVFERHKGICHISGRKIMAADKWDCDHIIALGNGGENRERNLAPALRDKHREKTKDDVAIKSKIARVRAKHLGINRSSGKLQSRGFDKTLSKKFNGAVEKRT